MFERGPRGKLVRWRRTRCQVVYTGVMGNILGIYLDNGKEYQNYFSGFIGLGVLEV